MESSNVVHLNKVKNEVTDEQLKAIVDAVSKKAEKPKQKKAAAKDQNLFEKAIPWSEPVDGAELLNEITATIHRFIDADTATIDAAALFAVFTWVHDCFKVSPIANISSPEPECGKSMFLEVLYDLSRKPVMASGISPAATYRFITQHSPTLLVDEVDVLLKDNPSFSSLFNASLYKRHAIVIKCDEDNNPRVYSLWAPIILCGIGKIPYEATRTRLIPLKLHRKRADKQLESMRYSDESLWRELRSKIARWSNDVKSFIGQYRPEPMPELKNRQNDCWEPLLAIADTVDGEWPERARSAARILMCGTAPAKSKNERLLSGIRKVFQDLAIDKIWKKELTVKLIENDDYWNTYNAGEPIKPSQVNRLLGEFDIDEKTVRIGSTSDRGYELALFKDAFSRYLPPYTTEKTVTLSQPL